MDISRATAEELEQAFQVDGTRARYIVHHRDEMGGFGSWEDVKQAPGFEDKMVGNLRAAGLTSFEDGMVENLEQAGARIE